MAPKKLPQKAFSNKHLYKIYVKYLKTTPYHPHNGKRKFCRRQREWKCNRCDFIALRRTLSVKLFDKNVRDVLRFTTANHTCFLVLFLELRALHLNLILTWMFSWQQCYRYLLFKIDKKYYIKCSPIWCNHGWYFFK